MWAATFPFCIPPLDVVAVFVFEAVFFAHLLTASQRESVVVRVARLGLWLGLQQTVLGWVIWRRCWRRWRCRRARGMQWCWRRRRARGMRRCWRGRRRAGGMRWRCWRIRRRLMKGYHLGLLLAYTCMNKLYKIVKTRWFVLPPIQILLSSNFVVSISLSVKNNKIVFITSPRILFELENMLIFF
jgi:hypothetical protein